MGVSIFNTGYDLQDQIDAAESAIAIVSVGDTHVAITSGQYVYVREHGTLAEGLYKATSNIAANATLSSSNVTAVSGGGLNALNSKSYTDNETISTPTSDTYIASLKSGTYRVVITNSTSYFPTNYGTLHVMNSDSNYKSYIYITTNNTMHFRIYNSDSGTWYAAWQELALNSKIAKKVNNKTDFGFPGYASDVHDGNNEYIVQHNGTAVFTIIFDNSNYSQIAIILNNNYITAENQMISSNGVNLENHIRYLTIPVFAGDVIKTGYYTTYGVKALKMRLLCGS